MAYDVAGKRVLVTGASSGIGAGLAEALARAGATVGLVARRTDRLAEVLERCRKHSPSSRMWVADLADPVAVDALAVAVMSELGGVDMLVNNAGIPKRRHVTALDAATVDAVMNINYSSLVRLTLALLPQMLERGEGRIVNVSSVAATLSPPGEAAYAASKAAVTVFSESMAIDLWDTGVKVTVIYPGVVDTELFTLPDNDPFTAQVESITVEEAVTTILAGVAADAAQVYVPAWFGDVASGKAADVEKFLAGTAEYIRQQGTNT
jgi:short-subunit dehydrogenase